MVESGLYNNLSLEGQDAMHVLSDWPGCEKVSEPSWLLESGVGWSRPVHSPDRESMRAKAGCNSTAIYSRFDEPLNADRHERQRDRECVRPKHDTNGQRQVYLGTVLWESVVVVCHYCG